MTQPSLSGLRQLGLLRTVLRRSRSEWMLVLAAWLLLACATSLIAAAAAFTESVGDGGFRRVLEASSPADTVVRVHANVLGTALGNADRAVRATVDSSLGAASGRVALIASTDSYSGAGIDPGDTAHQIVVGAYGEIDAHAGLVSGRWPNAGRETVEATLSAGAAKALGLGLGDRTSIVSKLDSSRRFELLIVGIWRPDGSDRYWAAEGLELTGVQTTGDSTVRGPFVIAAGDLASVAGNVAVIADWRWLPSIDTLLPGQGDPLRTGIGSLQDRLSITYPDTYVWVSSGLPDILAATARALLVAQSSILLLFAQFAVLAAYAILLVAGMLVDRRRPESALLRSRGASAGHLALLAFGEAVLLAIPAVAVAPFVAQAVVGLIGSVGPLASAGILAPTGVDGTAVATSIGAGAACVLVLTLPALPGRGTLAGMRAALGRQMDRTLAQRLGLDLVLLLVAGVAIWQLQLYGAPLTGTVRGGLGIDPLLVSAPAIGLLAGSLVATRAVPRLGELGEKLLARGRGLAAPMLVRQLGRRPLRYTRLALLLMLAAALGTFASIFSATWSRSQADQAAYRTAADVRVTVSDHPALSAWTMGAAYRSIDGVSGSVAVLRSPLEVGRDVTDGRLLAIDPAAAAKYVSFPSGALSGSADTVLADLAAGPIASMLEIPGKPLRLSVLLDTNLTERTESASSEEQSRVEVALVLSGPDGLSRIAGGTATLNATGTRVEVALAQTVGGVTYVPAHPLRLEAVELTVTGSSHATVSGSIRLRGVEASDEAGGSGWRPIGSIVGASGWRWSRVERGQILDYEPPASGPGLVSIGDSSGQAPTVQISPPDRKGATFRYVAAPQGDIALPALADSSLLSATGATVGDRIPASLSGYSSPIRIVATVSSFPTLDPAVPFLVVDAAALELVEYTSFGILETTKEWWLGTEPGRDDDVATALTGGPYSVSSVIARSDLADSLGADPIGLGVIGALLLGTIAAAAIAVIGFLVTVAFLARERLGEMALMRAVGESGAGLSRGLALEQVLLLVYGLALGCGIGLLLGWLAVPFSSMTSTGSAALPSPAIVVEWQLVLAALATAAATLAAGAAAVIVLTSGGNIAATLRGKDADL